MSEATPGAPLDTLAAAERAEREAQLQAAGDVDLAAEAAAAEPEGERLFAGKYKTPEEMERAYGELNSKLGELGNRAGNAERLAQQYEVQLQQYQQQQGPASGFQPGTGERQFLPDGTPVLSRTELDDLAQEDPYTAARLEGKYEIEAMRVQFEQRLEERDAPLVSVVHDMSARTAIETLKERVGAEMVEAHKDALREVIEQDPNHFADPKTQVARMEQAVYAAAYRQQQSGGGQPRAADGKFVHVEGGSSGAPQIQPRAAVEEGDQELMALADWKQPSDAFGAIPGHRSPR